MESKHPLYSIKIARADSGSSGDEHPTDGETIFTSSDNNVKSSIHIIPRRARDAVVANSRIEVNRDEPFVMSITRPVDSDSLGITVVFSGSSFMTFENGDTCRLEQGHCTMMAIHPYGRAEWRINPGAVYETMSFTSAREERLEMLKDIQLPPQFAELAADQIKTRVFWEAPALPAFLRIARDAKANPYRGAAKQFFLESKALEMFLELVTLLDQAPHADKTLGALEMKRLNDIRDSLMARYDNPPSLIELAAEAGMNYKKLNLKFQLAFGATMHGFLRDYRLERGRKMIAQGQGVKETSNMLGYRHPSAFIYAYKRKFGHPPRRRAKTITGY